MSMNGQAVCNPGLTSISGTRQVRTLGERCSDVTYYVTYYVIYF